MNLFIQNIRQLVTVSGQGKRCKSGTEMNNLGIINDAAVLIENGIFSWIGKSSEFTGTVPEGMDTLDASDLIALPGFVDSHTHAVFAGTREDEFAMRAGGKTYQDIAAAGGGILHTVNATRAATKKELKKNARRHLDGMLRGGTTTVEIKSGYGLSETHELKLMETISELADEQLIDIVPTFLGAHAVPPEYSEKPDEYIDIMCRRMLPYLVHHKYVQFCDVFCETGFFTIAQSRKVLETAKMLGVGLKMHADQLSQMGASTLAAELGATSADHLECVHKEGISALKNSGTIATLLPGVSFFLHYAYPPARTIIDAGIPVALATNFNPGSNMSYSMPLMLTIACTQMGLTPEEAITASTLNGAAALNLSDRIGSIEIGKQADIILYNVPNYRYLVYHYGANFVSKIIKRGTLLDF